MTQLPHSLAGWHISSITFCHQFNTSSTCTQQHFSAKLPLVTTPTHSHPPEAGSQAWTQISQGGCTPIGTLICNNSSLSASRVLFSTCPMMSSDLTLSPPLIANFCVQHMHSVFTHNTHTHTHTTNMHCGKSNSRF